MGCQPSRNVVSSIECKDPGFGERTKTVNAKHVGHSLDIMSEEWIVDPDLTEDKIKQIQQSWNTILLGSSDVLDLEEHSTCLLFFTETFFRRLFEIIPETRSCLKSSLKYLGKQLIDKITNLIHLLNEEKREEVLLEFYQTHITMNVENRYWEDCGDVLLYTLERCCGSSWSDETSEAWRHLYSHMMLWGFQMSKSSIPNEASNKERFLSAQILTINKFGLDSVRITLSLEQPLQYNPGDSILLGCPAGPSDGCIFRHYTILNPITLASNGKQEIQIQVKKIGIVSTWLSDKAVPNTTIKVVRIGESLKMHNSNLDPQEKIFYFFTSGAGITVPLSIVRALSLWKHGSSCSVRWLHTCSFEEEIPLYTEELESFAQGLQEFNRTFSVTRPRPNSEWNGLTGRIDEDQINSIVNLEQFQQAYVIICGPYTYNQDVQNLLLKTYPSFLQKKQIFLYDFDNLAITL